MTWRFLRNAVVAVCFVIFGALIAAKVNERPLETHAGAFRTVDGDSLAVGKIRLRLIGIDAPEMGQTCRRGDVVWDCGAEARNALLRLISGVNPVCDGDRHDKYGRLLVTCRAGGADINATMVRNGFAVAYGAYEGEEARARTEKVGIWSGSFDKPGDWRHSHGGLDESPDMHFPPFLRRIFHVE